MLPFFVGSGMRRDMVMHKTSKELIINSDSLSSGTSLNMGEEVRYSSSLPIAAINHERVQTQKTEPRKHPWKVSAKAKCELHSAINQLGEKKKSTGELLWPCRKHKDNGK